MDRHSDNILEFLDGSLDSSNEQHLFNALAGQPELRAELRQYYQIGEGVRADREAYTPPADVERDLLSGLGLLPTTAGVAGAGGAAGGAIGSGLAGGFGRRLLPMLAGLLVGALLAGSTVYLSMNSQMNELRENGMMASNRSDAAATGTVDADRENVSRQETDQRVVDQQGGRESNASVNGVGASSASGNSERGTGLLGNRTSGGYSGESGSNPNGPSIPNQEGVRTSEGTPSKTTERIQLRSAQPEIVELTDDILTENSPVDPKETEAHLRQIDPILSVESATSELRPARIQFEVRGSLLNNPLIDNGVSNPSPFSSGVLPESFAAGLYYSTHEGSPVGFSTPLYFGIEAGREHFSQALFHNRGDTILIRQSPSITWAVFSIGGEVNLLDQRLILQGGIGASQYGGPLVKGRIGIDLLDAIPGFPEDSPLMIPVSLEASSLVYQYNGLYSITGNWGVTAGARFRFDL